MNKKELKKEKLIVQIKIVYLLLWVIFVFVVLIIKKVRMNSFLLILSFTLVLMSVFSITNLIIKLFALLNSTVDEFYSNKVILLEEQLRNKEERLKALQSQINPHFLYNTLDTVRSMALEKKEKEISDVINALSQMFKYSMDFANSIVPISHEINQVKRYMKLQQLRFPERFTFEEIFKCSQDELHSVFLPKYCVQPLIENSIFHGFKGKDKNCNIKIIYISMGDSFQIEVRDNGIGMSESAVESINRLLEDGGKYSSEIHNGIALQNIYSRLKIYFGNSATMFFQSTMELGTIVTIVFPINRHV
ncbi:MAG: sensor histidine kinase [Erysipelotrichaceae bacterium]